MNNHTPSDTISWEALAVARPALAHAMYVAKHLQRRVPGFCANRVWYQVLKPMVIHSVGWNVEPRCPFGEHIQTVADLVADTPLEHTQRCHVAWAKQRWLHTSAAYDLAYQTVYAALPDCRHEGLCW